MKKSRIAFIVLDGAPFDLIASLTQENILPSFRMLMNKSSFNLLHSTIPPISPVAMPSLFSGKNPGKHGMFGFGRIEKGVFKPYLSTSMPAETLWDILGRFNKKVILLNVPWTFPPFKLNGIMISGPPTPRNQVKSYPPNIISTLESKIGPYFPDLNISRVDYIATDEKSLLNEAFLVTEKRAEAMYYLMENYEWDLLLAVFTTLDRIQHVFFGYFEEDSPLFNIEKREYLIDYYRRIDNIIGKVVSLLNENDYLIIASDHGFEYLHKYVGINNLLVQGGFAKKRSNFQIFTIEKIQNFLKQIGIKQLEKNIPRKVALGAEKMIPREIDFTRSKAYGVPSGYISINKQSLKNDEHYETVKKALINFFYSVRDESNGEIIVERIYDAYEIYYGDHVSDAPDLIIVFKRGYEPHRWRNRIIEAVKPIKNRTIKTGTHAGLLARRGIFIISGNGIKQNFSIETDIVNVTPTILHILGVPIPRDVDGQVLKEVFERGTKLLKKPVAYQEFWHGKSESRYKISREEETEIVEKLRRLGYI